MTDIREYINGKFRKLKSIIKRIKRNMPKVLIANYDLTIDVNPGYSLLNNFLYKNAPIHTVCGGHATCGCCRIKIIEGPKGMSPPNQFEILRLGEDLLQDGWRLSCQSYILRDIAIHMPTSEELDQRCSPKRKMK